MAVLSLSVHSLSKRLLLIADSRGENQQSEDVAIFVLHEYRASSCAASRGGSSWELLLGF